MPITQLNNAEKKSLEASRFRRLNNPVHAWGDVHNFVMALPGLVGYWPGAVNRATPLLLDVSKNGLHLTRNGDAEVALDPFVPFAPYLNLDGTGDYFSHADDAKLDITGTEVIIDSSLRGLTMMMWVYFASSATQQSLMSKYLPTGNQRGYLIQFDPFGMRLQFFLSSTGSNTPNLSSANDSITVATWHFVAARFTPSTEMALWTDDTKATTTTSIIASIFNNTSTFRIGEIGSVGLPLNGRIAFPLVCASALPDVVIETFYQMTAPLFGKQV